VVVGRSDIVGKPAALLLLHEHCHGYDLPLEDGGSGRRVPRGGDSGGGAGPAGDDYGRFHTAGAVVIDVGTTRVTDRALAARVFRNAATSWRLSTSAASR